jgi:hypothetical protein
MSFTAGQKVRASAQKSYVNTVETTTSTTYAGLTTAQTLTITSLGTTALIFVGQLSRSNIANQSSLASVAISGATTTSAAANEGAGLVALTLAISTTISVQASSMLAVPITAGTNTYTMQFRTGGAAQTATFLDRLMLVFAP